MSPKEASFCGVKMKPSLEGFVLTQLKQDLFRRAFVFAQLKECPRRHEAQRLIGYQRRGRLRFVQATKNLTYADE